MRDSLREEGSPRESIEIEQKQCNAIHAIHALHENEKRYNRSIRLRDSVHRAVKQYCGVAQMTMGQLYESGALMFMQVNHVAGVFLNVENTENNHQTDDDWMLDLICIGDLEDFIELMDTLIRNGTPIHKIRMKQFLVILRECKKVKKRSQKLDSLISKARSYFG